MIRYLNSFTRKAGALLAAGYLLQASGCAVDTTTLVGGLVTAIANSLISDVVYGLFNIPFSGF